MKRYADITEGTRGHITRTGKTFEIGDEGMFAPINEITDDKVYILDGSLWFNRNTVNIIEVGA